MPPPGASNRLMGWLLLVAWVALGSICPFPALSVVPHLWSVAGEPGQSYPNFLLWAPSSVCGFCHACEKGVRTECGHAG